jgi:ABC-type antimicrobial peptide transport system permease subunit
MSALRDRLKQHDPNLAAFEVHAMSHWVDRSSLFMRIRTQLMAALGAIALVLGIVGIYAVMSFLVTQRAQEFGVRMAFGARPSTLPLGVVARGVGYAVAGLAIGLSAAALTMDKIQSLLFQIDARDPATLATVAGGVVVTAAIAWYFPARRAAAVDPLVVLRGE